MNFDALITVADWTQALQQLIALANNAVQKNDQNDISNIQSLLIEFQRQSPPSMNSLDAIAFSAANALNKSQRKAILDELADLTKQLNGLSKLVDVATEQALMSSEEIQLKNTKDVLTKAKISLEILQGLRTDLQGNTGLGGKIDALVKAINEFEQAF